ncbi:MAG: DNA polymerase III subunit beta [Armatimonadota bacterium]
MLKAVCPRSRLFERLQIVGRAVSSRSTLPILSNVFVEGEGERLRFVATDLELGIECSMEAEVVEAGSLTAPARIFTEVVQNLPEAAVTIEADETNTARVTCGTSEYAIRGLPAEEFSSLPDLVDPVSYTVPERLLRRVIEQTSFAASPDETRPILTGGLFSVSGTEARLVATDTHRLALRRLPEISPAEAATGESEGGKAEGAKEEAQMNVIVPARALREVAAVLDGESEEPVTMSITSTQVAFEVRDIRICSRLIEGEFPKYEKVIPEEYERKAVLSIAEFQQALRRALIVAREDANRVVLSLGSDAMTITADSQDVGRGSERIAAQVEGEPLEIAFNARYLLDALATMDGEQVDLELCGALKPGLLRMSGDQDYTYVLMPMQIM